MVTLFLVFQVVFVFGVEGFRQKGCFGCLYGVKDDYGLIMDVFRTR